jgi:hypothetical protein
MSTKTIKRSFFVKACDVCERVDVETETCTICRADACACCWRDVMTKTGAQRLRICDVCRNKLLVGHGGARLGAFTEIDEALAKLIQFCRDALCPATPPMLPGHVVHEDIGLAKPKKRRLGLPHVGNTGAQGEGEK